MAAAAQVVANDEVMTEYVQKSSSLSVVKPIEQGILRQSVRQQTKSKQRAPPSVQPLKRDRAKLLMTIYAQESLNLLRGLSKTEAECLIVDI